MILKLYGSAEAEPFQNATFSTFVFPLCSMLCVPFVQYALCSLCAVCSVFPLCSMLCVPFVQYALCSLCVLGGDLLIFYTGFQRSTGLRAAAVSSSRQSRVECGASSTIWVSSSTSCAIDFIASMNKSSSALSSLSVGSIISAPGTISGNAVV